MKTLFDASALVNLVRLEGPGSLNYLEGNYITSLTPYEVGNAIWKEAVLHERITLAEATRLIEYFSLIYKRMKTVNPSSQTLTLELAGRLGVTFYDASYITAARDNSAVLVTDDRKLLSRIKRNASLVKTILGGGVEALSLNDLLKT